PFACGHLLCPRCLLIFLHRLHTLFCVPRHRPCPWLRRLVQLGMSLRAGETAVVG
ncbi:3-hydroxyacyl-CoA dehydrogenase, partial [Pseudomonas aeruginosa]